MESIQIDLMEPIASSGIRLDMDAFRRAPVHPDVPIELESVIALSLLSTYEYLQHGDVPKMRSLANDTMVAAKTMSLNLEIQHSDQFSEARRRAWWMTVSFPPNP
jgi:hypothetical protein